MASVTAAQAERQTGPPPPLAPGSSDGPSARGLLTVRGPSSIAGFLQSSPGCPPWSASASPPPPCSPRAALRALRPCSCPPRSWAGGARAQRPVGLRVHHSRHVLQWRRRPHKDAVAAASGSRGGEPYPGHAQPGPQVTVGEQAWWTAQSPPAPCPGPVPTGRPQGPLGYTLHAGAPRTLSSPVGRCRVLCADHTLRTALRGPSTPISEVQTPRLRKHSGTAVLGSDVGAKLPRDLTGGKNGGAPMGRGGEAAGGPQPCLPPSSPHTR